MWGTKRGTRKDRSRRSLFALVALLLSISLASISYIEQASAAASITLSRTSGSPSSTVTVTGTGFARNTVTAILFDYAFVEETTTSANGAFTKSITIPTTANGGIHRITANDGVSSVDSTFTVDSQTMITLSPTNGVIGSTVTVTGSNFGASKTITIRFDNSNISTNPVTVISTGTGSFAATLAIPSNAIAGSHTVSATDGTLMASGIFNVSGSSIVTISPTSGAVGTMLTVTGSGFSGNGVVTIKFDSTTLVTSPASITTSSSGTFSATINVPTGIATGSHTISATDSSGRGGSAIFNITTSGTISLSSNAGIGGTAVTISGSGYNPSSTVTVKFDSTTLITSPSVVTTNTAGSFTATIAIPSGTSLGSHTISATDSSGRTASTIFNVTTAGIITISPVSGPTGTEVALTGSNFAPNTKISIKFGNISVRTFPVDVVTSNTGTFIAMFDVPAGVSGSHSVTASDSTSRTGSGVFAVTAPSVSLLPISGNVITAGAPVTVSGFGFVPNIEVTLMFDGNIIATNPSKTTTTNTGTFTASLIIPVTASLGSHTMTVRGGGETAIESFNVISRLQSSITLSSAGAAPGSPITVSGSGFIPNTSVTVKFDSSILATTVTTSSGSFFVTFSAPLSVAPGTHIVSASDGTNIATSTVTVIRGEDIVSVADLRLVDSGGVTVSRPTEGSPVLIRSNLRNNLSTEQDFVYIVQVKDSQGVTVMISWMSGTLPAGKEYAVATSWLVEDEGRYNVEVFTWDSITDPDVLAPSLRTTVRV